MNFASKCMQDSTNKMAWDLYHDFDQGTRQVFEGVFPKEAIFFVESYLRCFSARVAMLINSEDINKPGLIFYANEEAEKLTGIKLAEAVGQNIVELGLISARAHHDLMTALRNDGSCKNYDLTIWEGKPEAREISVSARKQKVGDHECWVAVFHDYTHKADLSDLIRQHNQALIQASTLLQGVQMNLQMVQEKISTGDTSEEAQQQLAKGIERVNKIFEIITELSDEIKRLGTIEEKRRMRDG